MEQIILNTNVLRKFGICLLLMVTVIACDNKVDKNIQQVSILNGKKNEVRLMTIDPGHFHAALVQKEMYDQISPEVYVFAPEGPDVHDHLDRIEGYNSRKDNPTIWMTIVYTGNDYLQKMIEDRPGNVMVTAGNNQKKTEYIKAAVDAGIHVLADKPMAIDQDDFSLLQSAFQVAAKNNVLLYDIMTERYEITTILQRELSMIPEIYGVQQTGSPDNPAVTKESVHHFFKYVSGNKIKRPPWFFDVTQEGEGIVDVTTHLVDLIQWECFPGQIIDYTKDIEMLSAKRWATPLTKSQFRNVTRLDTYPQYLKKYIIHDDILNVFSNGEMIYKLKGIHAKVSVVWNYQAPEGTGDTHFSIMKGSRANLVIRQGVDQKFKPVLYVEPVVLDSLLEYEADLNKSFLKIEEKYPGVSLKKLQNKWVVGIPEKYRIGHEAHFSQVTKKFLKYLVDGKLPEWEVPNMIAKYYTTTKALELAKNK